MSARIFLLVMVAVGLATSPVMAQKKEPAAAKKSGPLTKPQAEAFAQKIETQITAGDGTLATESVDFSSIAARALVGIDPTADAIKEFGSGLSMNFQLGAEFLAGAESSHSFQLLRVRTIDNRQRALFRGANGNGIFYWDLLLSAGGANGVKVDDIYQFSQAEWLSESLRRGITGPGADDPAIQKKLKGADLAYSKQFPALRAFENAAATGNFERSLELFKDLPDGLKKQKSVAIALAGSATQVSPGEGAKAIEHFKQVLAQEQAMEYLLLAPLLSLEKHDEAIAAIDRFEKAIGGDRYLLLLRGDIQISAGKPDKAQSLYQEAMKQDPLLESAYWSLVYLHLDNKNYAETAKVLTSIEAKFKTDLGDLKDDDTFAEFVQSKEYPQWMKSKKK